MNHYALMIRNRWQAMAPENYSRISNPESFFSPLGEEMLTTVTRLTDSLVEPSTSEEDFLTRVGRLNAARMSAEEIALQDVPWPSTEIPPNELREEWESTRSQESGLAEWMSSLDRPLMEHELEELSERWILPSTFLEEMAESASPMIYLDSHSEAVSSSQEQRFARYLQSL